MKKLFIILLVIISFALVGFSVNKAQAHHYQWCEGDDCHVIVPTITPTSTPTPEIIVTPTATPTPILEPQNGSGGSSQAPDGDKSTTNPLGPCGDVPPAKVANFIVVTDPLGLKLEWSLFLDAQTVDIRFGLHDGQWIYGQLGLANDGHYVVQGLQPNTPYFFQIAGQNGCAIGTWSDTVDPQWQGK